MPEQSQKILLASEGAHSAVKSFMSNNQILGTQGTGDKDTSYILSQPLQVGYSWGIQAMAWGSFAFLLWLLIALVQEDSLSQLSPIHFILGGLLLVSIGGVYKFSQRIRVNTESIAVVGWFGQREIKWGEIRQIKARKYLADIAICGDNKTVVVTSPSNWRGRDLQMVLDYLDAQIRAQDIEVSA